MSLRKIPTVVIAAVGCIFLWGCIFSTNSFVSRPAELNPDDAFASGSQRSYLWKEGWTVGKRDSSVPSRTLNIRNLGDTSINGVSYQQIHFEAVDGKTLPASVVTHLGFNPSLLKPDSIAIPDPGASLGFPLHPEIGWRSEITSGDLHIVRELKGLDTLSRPEGLVEAWAFAESTYWEGTPISTATYSMGRTGLLHLLIRHSGFNTGGDTASATSWKEVTAL